MFNPLKKRLEQMLFIEEEASESEKIRAVNIAAAALLIEAAQADQKFTNEEWKEVERSLTSHMNIPRADFQETIDLAKNRLSQSTCLHEITEVVNENWHLGEKIRLIESLWRVVLSDKRIDAHEQHLMRKLQGLLHIPHKEYIAAKVRIQNSIKN